MVKTAAEVSETESCPEPLFDRAHLIRRWQHGSGTFFWRAERAGRLRPVRNNRLLRYRWHDVLLFEGGLPPAELAEAYTADLMHPTQVAKVCCCKTSFLQAAVLKGTLPVRTIGRAPRFVPAEVALWQQREWPVRKLRMNEQSSKTSPFKPKE